MRSLCAPWRYTIFASNALVSRRGINSVWSTDTYLPIHCTQGTAINTPSMGDRAGVRFHVGAMAKTLSKPDYKVTCWMDSGKEGIMNKQHPVRSIVMLFGAVIGLTACGGMARLPPSALN